MLVPILLNGAASPALRREVQPAGGRKVLDTTMGLFGPGVHMCHPNFSGTNQEFFGFFFWGGVVCLFWPCQRHVRVPGPGIEPSP